MGCDVREGASKRAKEGARGRGAAFALFLRAQSAGALKKRAPEDPGLLVGQKGGGYPQSPVQPQLEQALHPPVFDTARAWHSGHSRPLTSGVGAGNGSSIWRMPMGLT